MIPPSLLAVSLKPQQAFPSGAFNFFGIATLALLKGPALNWANTVRIKCHFWQSFQG